MAAFIYTGRLNAIFKRNRAKLTMKHPLDSGMKIRSRNGKKINILKDKPTQRLHLNVTVQLELEFIGQTGVFIP